MAERLLSENMTRMGGGIPESEAYLGPVCADGGNGTVVYHTELSAGWDNQNPWKENSSMHAPVVESKKVADPKSEPIQQEPDQTGSNGQSVRVPTRIFAIRSNGRY